MNEITSKKEAIEMLFQELYESGNEIWADTIHACMLYLADDAECFNIVEELNEEYEAKDLRVIHKDRSYEIVKEELDKALREIRYKQMRHHSLI